MIKLPFTVARLISHRCENNVIEKSVPKNIRDTLEENKDIAYTRSETIEVFEKGYKYVGAILADNSMIYGIPTGASSILEINPKKNTYNYFGKLSDDAFKWTNGCFYKGYVYGYPRFSNNLLRINPETHEVEEINLNLHYSKEHHYSGALVGNTVYQPPRNSDHILCINLDDYTTSQIPLGKNMAYNGCIYHYNGLIYMFPVYKGDKVLVLNPATKTFSFIGDGIENCTIYGASIALNGSIYGCSSGRGMLKINPSINEVKILYPYVYFGSFGTQIGINGKLYSIPGSGKDNFEFDPSTEKLMKLNKFSDPKYNYAKCAGSVVSEDGSIWCLPAFGRYIYTIRFTPVHNAIAKNIIMDRRFCSY